MLILLGFGLLIFVMLKYRAKLLAADIQITTEQVWESMQARAALHGLNRPELLYGIFQDRNARTSELVIKDANGQVRGRVEYPWGRREFQLVADRAYRIRYLLTWKKSAQLIGESGEVIATFKRMPNAFTRHQFVAEGIVPLCSRKMSFSLNGALEYTSVGREGTQAFSQKISKLREIGQCAVFKPETPMAIRLFLLAITARGI